MYLTPANAAVVALAGGLVGVLGAILGTGGGVFLVPILVLGLGLPMHHAVATSIVSVVATSSAVASVNVERGLANMRLGMTLEVATTLGAIAGGLTAALVPARGLEGLFAAALVPLALLMWRGRAGLEDRPPDQDHVRAGPGESVGRLGARYLDESSGLDVSYRVRRPRVALGISFLAGNLSGLLGIGGGVFKVPGLHLACGVPIKAAAATSNFMIGVTAAASAFLYYGRGEVHPATTAAAVLGVLAGSASGSRLNRRVGGLAVRRLFAGLMVLMSIQMFLKALVSGKV